MIAWLRQLLRRWGLSRVEPRYTVWWIEVEERELEGLRVEIITARSATYPNAESPAQAIAMHRSDFPHTRITHVTWFE